MPQKIKIAIVDDHSMFRQGLASLLREYDDLKVVFEASNGKELLGLLKKTQPHIILLDIQMPYLDGMETTVEIKKSFPDIKIIIITSHSEEALIFDLITKGINGFLTKDNSVDHVIEAIYSVQAKGFYYTEEVTKAMLKGVRNKQKMRTSLQTSDLTDREVEIIQLICKQYSIKDIAEQLTLSPRTVETHKENILVKTGSKNIAGIVLYAVEHQLL